MNEHETVLLQMFCVATSVNVAFDRGISVDSEQSFLQNQFVRLSELVPVLKVFYYFDKTRIHQFEEKSSISW